MYLAYLTTHDDDYKRREPSSMYSEKTFKSEKKATEYIANELMDAILQHMMRRDPGGSSTAIEILFRCFVVCAIIIIIPD